MGYKFNKEKCPICGKMVADNWWVRHMRIYHSDEPKEGQMGLEQYAVHMEWDSYSGSPFKETSTTWEDAYSEQDARDRARSKYGYHKGFQIKFVIKEK